MENKFFKEEKVVNNKERNAILVKSAMCKKKHNNTSLSRAIERYLEGVFIHDCYNGEKINNSYFAEYLEHRSRKDGF